MRSARRQLELVDPAFFSAPPWALTLGPEVVDLCTDAGYEPDPEQALALDVLFAENEHGLPSVFEFAAICARQNMKALATTTPLLTERGWSTMGDVAVGDRVFHPDGHAVEVVGVSDVKLGHRCYRVTTTDGRSVVADAGHLWTVQDRRRRSPEWETVTTAQLVAAGVERSPRGMRQVQTSGVRYRTSELRWRLPRQEPIKSEDRDLPIDPYLFGAWLGDGKSTSGSLSSHVGDVAHWVTHIRQSGYVPTTRVDRTCTTIGITTTPGVGRHGRSFSGKLRELGVLGNKHVPDEYLTAGPNQREALLQGLLDTDGTIHHRSGQVTFTTTRRSLGDAGVYLARSLGWRASLREGRALLNGRDCGPKFTVTFTPKTSDPFAPFRMERKLSRVGNADGGKGRFAISIKSIEPVDSVAVRCIKVDSPDGLFLAGRDLVPTHNTGLFKQAALGWLFVTEEHRIAWSAHEFDTARESFTDLVEIIESTPMMSKRLAPGTAGGIFTARGSEAIELASGARIKFKARTKSGSRGLTGDKTVLDEAFALDKSHMGAVMPIMSTRPTAQILYGSSACHENSDVLRKIVRRGRAGDSVRLGYIEYAVVCELGEECTHMDGVAGCNRCQYRDCDHEPGTPGCAMDREELWQSANPQAGRRISWQYLRDERQALDPSEFGRERMGWHDEPAAVGGALVSSDQWWRLKDADSVPLNPVSFGFYVSRDRTSSAIAVAGMREDGRMHVEIVPAVRGKSLESLPGTSWIRGRIAELREQWSPAEVVTDGRSAAASLIPDLENDGVITTMNAQDMAAACGVLYDAIVEDKLRHRGQQALGRAVLGAKTRNLSDAWAWDAKDPTTDITQLLAVTAAVHGVRVRTDEPRESAYTDHDLIVV